MNKYIFTGTIYPERVDFNLYGLESRYKKISFTLSEWGIDGSFAMTVYNSKARIIFESKNTVDHTTKPNIETLKNIIERIARLFIDTFCFIHSYNYDLIIDSVSCNEISLDHTFSVKGEVDHEGKDENFVKYLDIILNNQSEAIGYALADYRRSIKYPDTTASHCLRAIESLRRAYFDDDIIHDNNKRDKDGWLKMAKKLKIKPNSSYELIQKYATPNRHGIFPKITWEERREIMEFTRMVIEKIFEWLGSNK